VFAFIVFAECNISLQRSLRKSLYNLIDDFKENFWINNNHQKHKFQLSFWDCKGYSARGIKILKPFNP